MATTDEIRTRISAIDVLLASGVRSASNGDHSVEYDHKSLKEERESLKRQLYASASQFQRVVFK